MASIYVIKMYIPVSTGQEILYLHIPVRTGIYRYTPVHTILPDPVQVYRIPDVRCSPGRKPAEQRSFEIEEAAYRNRLRDECGRRAGTAQDAETTTRTDDEQDVTQAGPLAALRLRRDAGPFRHGDFQVQVFILEGRAKN